jgi:hypothetical protein
MTSWLQPEFIELHDILVDIMNSRRLYALGYKAAISEKTITGVLEIFAWIQNLYDVLEDQFGQKILHSCRRCAFFGFLTNMDAIERLYLYMETGRLPLQFLSTYKLCQDHLEILLNAIR